MSINKIIIEGCLTQLKTANEIYLSDNTIFVSNEKILRLINTIYRT